VLDQGQRLGGGPAVLAVGVGIRQRERLDQRIDRLEAAGAEMDEAQRPVAGRQRAAVAMPRARLRAVPSQLAPHQRVGGGIAGAQGDEGDSAQRCHRRLSIAELRGAQRDQLPIARRPRGEAEPLQHRRPHRAVARAGAVAQNPERFGVAGSEQQPPEAQRSDPTLRPCAFARQREQGSALAGLVDAVEELQHRGEQRMAGVALRRRRQHMPERGHTQAGAAVAERDHRLALAEEAVDVDERRREAFRDCALEPRQPRAAHEDAERRRVRGKTRPHRGIRPPGEDQREQLGRQRRSGRGAGALELGGGRRQRAALQRMRRSGRRLAAHEMVAVLQVRPQHVEDLGRRRSAHRRGDHRDRAIADEVVGVRGEPLQPRERRPPTAAEDARRRGDGTQARRAVGAAQVGIEVG
jgi:hypothetical protein